MVTARERKPSRAHVGVTDGLYLFQSVPFNDLVKFGEIIVNALHQLFGGEVLGIPGKSLEIGEQHSDRIELLGLHPTFFLELIGRFLGQDVE